jgi:hypothetical protein
VTPAGTGPAAQPLPHRPRRGPTGLPARRAARQRQRGRGRAGHHLAVAAQSLPTAWARHASLEPRGRPPARDRRRPPAHQPAGQLGLDPVFAALKRFCAAAAQQLKPYEPIRATTLERARSAVMACHARIRGGRRGGDPSMHARRHRARPAMRPWSRRTRAGGVTTGRDWGSPMLTGLLIGGAAPPGMSGYATTRRFDIRLRRAVVRG